MCSKHVLVRPCCFQPSNYSGSPSTCAPTFHPQQLPRIPLPFSSHIVDTLAWDRRLACSPKRHSTHPLLPRHPPMDHSPHQLVPTVVLQEPVPSSSQSCRRRSSAAQPLKTPHIQCFSRSLHTSQASTRCRLCSVFVVLDEGLRPRPSRLEFQPS